MTVQYIQLLNKILDEGEWVFNERTKSRCKTLIDETFEFNVGKGEFPLVTTRKSYYRQAIGEMIGYLRGYNHIEQFHELGVHTWDANAANPDWLNSDYYKLLGHEGLLGTIYGAAGNVIPKQPWDKTQSVMSGGEIRVLDNIIQKLKDGKDDRGLIWNFWRPEVFDQGCLRPCVYQHQFSLVGNKLYLSSTQRSADVCLGTVFNMVQCYFLLWVIARLTGKQPAIAKLRMINMHIYENQIELAKEQAKRQPYPLPQIHCNKPISYESLFGCSDDPRDNLHPNDFDIINYQYHPPIKYPFTV